MKYGTIDKSNLQDKVYLHDTLEMALLLDPVEGKVKDPIFFKIGVEDGRLVVSQVDRPNIKMIDRVVAGLNAAMLVCSDDKFKEFALEFIEKGDIFYEPEPPSVKLPADYAGMSATRAIAAVTEKSGKETNSAAAIAYANQHRNGDYRTNK